MKTKLETIGTVLLGVVFVLFASTIAAQAATIYVDVHNTSGIEDGTEEYPFDTIGEGVDAASAGDTVKVAAGEYGAGSTIDKNLTLLGAGPDTTRIRRSGTGNVFAVNSYVNATIIGFEIANGNNGIYVKENGVATIKNNVIVNNTSYGILGQGDVKTNITVVNNTIVQNGNEGINVNGSESVNAYLTAINNIISLNEDYGMWYADATIYNYYNTLWYNDTGTYHCDNECTQYNENNSSGDPKFVDADTGDYHLLSNSPCIDAGRAGGTYVDPDGTRNNKGAYGGPDAAPFWPDPAGAPVITSLTVTPSSVPQEGTITIEATGEVRE